MLLKTPYYLIDERLLRRNLALIRSVAERADVEIILAFKAYSLWRTFPILREYISSTTASSPWEARLGFEQFGAPCHTFSPAYTEEDFPLLLQCSSHLTFNSIGQMHRFMPVLRAYNEKHPTRRVSPGLRINPEHSHIETPLYDPCAPGSRFGVLSDILRGEDVLGEGIEGFHCHCHCESSAEELADNLTYVEARFGDWLPHLRWLNLGGGHLMTREDYNVELLIHVLQELHHRYPQLHIILEPGSAFGWQTGPLVCSVVDVVENHGIRTAIIDVSFTCHMPDCLEMPYKPIVREEIANGECTERNKPSVSGAECYEYRLGGNSCLSGDFVEGFRFDHELRVGERLHIEDMNHYTTVKTTMFNGIQHPSLVIQRMDGSFEILRTFAYEDYRGRMD